MNGWVIPSTQGGTKAHYFVDGRSKCGQWTFGRGNGYKVVAAIAADSACLKCKACSRMTTPVSLEGVKCSEF